ncbi:MAG TPA: serine hydrolase [Verrucomicrobiae bacterium]|nr:serine hydrolase [Verrucomicrobiae bacterium]
MRRLIIGLWLAATLAAQPLVDQLRARAAQFQGTTTLYAKNLDTGAAVGIKETDPVRTASTIKLPIMTAVFDAVANGKAQWTDLLTIDTPNQVSGSGVIGNELSAGVQLPLRDVVHLMIVLSDNSATNMVLDRVTANDVNAYLDRIGITATRSLRKVRGDGTQLSPARGWSDFGQKPENQKYGIGVSTPLDMVTLLERLEKGELVNADASKEMLTILKRQQDNTGIRRFLGDNVANKTGALDALRADVGIVYSKGGPIAMAIYVDGIPTPDWGPDNVGSILISNLAKMIVEGLAKPDAN